MADSSSPAAASLGELSNSLDAVLPGIRERAARYDRDNAFFHEDLEELRRIGFLWATVPVDFGGLGLSVPDFARLQSRLATHAPSTALALNMHQYWVGTALHLRRLGEASADWILREAGAGRLFAAGHGEPGNDLGLAHSLVEARPTGDGGYRFHGRKVLTSLSPVWDWLGVHGLDASDPAHPRIVHAFIRRAEQGHRSVATWDALGLRATRSDDTFLEGAEARPEHVIRVLPAGPVPDAFVDGILGAVLPGLAAVYLGIGRRALELALASATQRTSLLLEGKSQAHKPLVQHDTARAVIRLDAADSLVASVVDSWWGDDFPRDGGALPRLQAAKQNAVEGAQEIVDLAQRIVGASSLARSHELERLYRDVRAGAFHPPNTESTLELIGKHHLGLLAAA